MTNDIKAWEDFCEVKILHDSEEYKKDCLRFTFLFLFKTKEEYLNFRNCWKVRYKELSNEIREQKKVLRNEMKEQAKKGTIGGDAISYDCWRNERTLSNSQREARKMMSALEQAKSLAKIQAEASRRELVAENG